MAVVTATAAATAAYQFLKANLGPIFGIKGLECIYDRIPVGKLPALASNLIKDGWRDDNYAGGYTATFLEPYMRQCGLKNADVYLAKRKIHGGFGGMKAHAFYHKKYIKALQMQNAAKNATSTNGTNKSVNNALLSFGSGGGNAPRKTDNTALYIGVGVLVFLALRKK